MWDSQFLRYIKVLDTDHSNYIALYQCMEDARFFNRDDDKELEPQEAWSKALQSDIDFEKRPISKYHFSDQVRVEPFYFETV